MIHLLRDHKIVLGSTSITRIGVCFHENSERQYNYLWAELTGANMNQKNLSVASVREGIIGKHL